MNVHSRRGVTLHGERRRWASVLLLIIISIILTTFLQRYLYLQKTKDNCLVSLGSYRGNKYESTAADASRTSGETIGNKCLIQSQWMRVAQHQVQIMDNKNNNNQAAAPTTTKVIDDWLWIDYHDRINVLVQDPNSSTSFLILKQTKYALSSQESLAVVGGIVEPDEDALDAAKREVDEELHVTCNSWTSLGRYRTDVNRGMGWVHPYLARDCTYSKTDVGSGGGGGVEQSDTIIGAHDTEAQKIQSMTLSEVKVALQNAQFVEVQWSNTVALAILRLM